MDEAGDDLARFTVLFETHWPAIERYARRRVERDVAADVAAEVFAVAWRRLADVPYEPLPWLYGVARRLVANQRRSDERRVRLADRVAVTAGSTGHPVADPDETVPANLTFAAAFDRLSDADREALALVAWEGLDARSAATVIGCGVGAFTMRLTRARRRLRALLDAQDSDEGTS